MFESYQETQITGNKYSLKLETEHDLQPISLEKKNLNINTS